MNEEMTKQAQILTDLIEELAIWLVTETKKNTTTYAELKSEVSKIQNHLNWFADVSHYSIVIHRAIELIETEMDNTEFYKEDE